jgi:hypothetical protein
MGLFSFETAWRTLLGDESMKMIRKGQLQAMEKKNNLTLDLAVLDSCYQGMLA